MVDHVFKSLSLTGMRGMKVPQSDCQGVTINWICNLCSSGGPWLANPPHEIAYISLLKHILNPTKSYS